MGSEIALVFAMAGHDVLLADRREAEGGAALGRIRTTTNLEHFADQDLVTEAVYEDLDVKSEVLARLDEVCRPECVIATNTSTIPISTLAAKVSAGRRTRFIGTHYFSPASRMKLVEVIPAFDTSEPTFEFACRMCRAAGKTPIRVKDVAGFAVNRVLHVFLIEAVRLVEEGVATPEDIDTACKLGLGHPIGPFELMDATTSSLCVQAQEIMQEAYGERFRPRPLLKQRVRAGLVGGRNAKGWRR